MSNVKVISGDRVLYVKPEAVENMKKHGFEPADRPKKTPTRKAASRKTHDEEAVSDESTDE